MFCVWILEKNCKSAKLGKFGHYWAPTPQRREPTLGHRPTPSRGIPSSQQGQGAKMAPFKYATVQHYCVAA